MAFITIPAGDGENYIFMTDTIKQITIARSALRMHGIVSARVWIGHPDDPSSYKGHEILFADDPAKRSVKNNPILQGDLRAIGKLANIIRGYGGKHSDVIKVIGDIFRKNNQPIPEDREIDAWLRESE